MHLKANCKTTVDVTGWDNFAAPLAIGPVSSALTDYDTGLPSSVALDSNIAWAGDSADSTVVADFFGWETNVWKYYWYVAVASGGDVLTLTGLNPGEVYTLRLAGHNGNGRITSFNATGSTNGPLPYTPGPGTSPAIYIELTGVVPGDGIVNISLTGSNSFIYLTAIEFTSAVGTISTTMTTDFLEPVNFTDQTSFSFNNTTQSEASVSVTPVTVPPSNTMEYSVEWNNPPAYGDAVECIIAAGHNYVTEATGILLDPQTLSSGTNCIQLPPETNGPLAIPDVTFGQYLDYDTSLLFNADPAINTYTFNGVLPPGCDYDTTTGKLTGYPYVLGLSGTISITGTSTIGVATTTDDTFSVLSSGSDLVVTAPTTADGDPLTVTTVGYSFGVKSQVAPRLTVRGSDVREDGVVNTTSPEALNVQGTIIEQNAVNPTSIWQNSTVLDASVNKFPAIIDKTDLPHTGVDNIYRCEYDSSFGFPMVMQPLYQHDRLYVSFKTKSFVDLKNLKSVLYTGGITNGPFDAGSTPFDLGETVTITGGFTGTVVAVDTGISRIQIITVATSVDMNGQTITGDISGASTTLTNDIIFASVKVIRCWEDSAIEVDATCSAIGLMMIYTRDNNVEIPGTRIQISVDSPYSPNNAGSWRLFNFEADYSGATGTIRQEIDVTNYKDTISNVDLSYRSTASGPPLSIIGCDSSRNNYNGLTMYADIYVDDTLQKIVIANAATWDAVTHYEPLIPTAWADKSTTAEIYKGMLGAVSGSWVYVFDNGPSGLPLNSSGVVVP